MWSFWNISKLEPIYHPNWFFQNVLVSINHSLPVYPLDRSPVVYNFKTNSYSMLRRLLISIDIVYSSFISWLRQVTNLKYSRLWPWSCCRWTQQMINDFNIVSVFVNIASDFFFNLGYEHSSWKMSRNCYWNWIEHRNRLGIQNLLSMIFLLHILQLTWHRIMYIMSRLSSIGCSWTWG